MIPVELLVGYSLRICVCVSWFVALYNFYQVLFWVDLGSLEIML